MGKIGNNIGSLKERRKKIADENFNYSYRIARKGWKWIRRIDSRCAICLLRNKGWSFIKFRGRREKISSVGPHQRNGKAARVSYTH